MTEITDLSTTDSSNTTVTGESIDGAIANMGRMDNTLQAILGLLARSIRTNVLRFLDNADPTKKVALDLSGLPTATERTWTAPYYSGTLGLVSDIRGQIFGLTLSNNVTDPTNDIDIAAGTVVDSTGVASIQLLVGLTKRADAVWAAGTNQGGRFYTTLVDGTLHWYVIRNPTTGVVDVGFSDNATNPTGGASYPAGFTQYRRILSITRVSGAIRPFSQMGEQVLWKAPTNDVSTTTLGNTATLFTLPIPLGIKVGTMLAGYVSGAATPQVYLSSPDQDDIGAGNNGPVGPSAGGFGGIGYPIIRSNTSGQIRARANAANTTLNMSCLGYVDAREAY